MKLTPKQESSLHNPECKDNVSCTYSLLKSFQDVINKISKDHKNLQEQIAAMNKELNKISATTQSENY